MQSHPDRFPRADEIPPAASVRFPESRSFSPRFHPDAHKFAEMPLPAHNLPFLQNYLLPALTAPASEAASKIRTLHPHIRIQFPPFVIAKSHSPISAEPAVRFPVWYIVLYPNLPAPRLIRQIPSSTMHTRESLFEAHSFPIIPVPRSLSLLRLSLRSGIHFRMNNFFLRFPELPGYIPDKDSCKYYDLRL